MKITWNNEPLEKSHFREVEDELKRLQTRYPNLFQEFMQVLIRGDLSELFIEYGITYKLEVTGFKFLIPSVLSILGINGCTINERTKTYQLEYRYLESITTTEEDRQLSVIFDCVNIRKCNVSSIDDLTAFMWDNCAIESLQLPESERGVSLTPLKQVDICNLLYV